MTRPTSTSEPLPRRAYRIKEFAEMFGLPLSTAHDMARRRAIETLRVNQGRRSLVMVTAEAIERFVEEHRVSARRTS